MRLPRPSASSIVTGVIVTACVATVFSQLHPSLLLMNSTTSGGDMGAHTWAPWYLKHHLLPHGRISGWTPDWYDGFPALTFYFPLPAMLIVLLSYVIPYAIAFKLITVAGICSFPVAAWAFGRLARLPFPAPACLAAASLLFLFDTGYSILGGNIASTLAGEFAFSIALSLSLVFLGLVAGGLDTGRRRWLAALCFGAILICHILPTIFALVGGLILLLMRMMSKGRIAALRWAIPVGIVGALLSGFWAIPFILRSTYMNDMGWEKIGTGKPSGLQLYGESVSTYTDALFPGDIWWALVTGFAGAGLALFLRRKIGIFLLLVAAISAFGFIVMPQGRLWNARLLPFWYLSLYLLTGLLIAEIGWGLAGAVRRWRNGEDLADGLKYAAPIGAFVGALSIIVPQLPPPAWWPLDSTTPWHDPTTAGASYIPSWAEWNYAGFDGKRSDGSWYKPAHPEYQSLVSAMSDIGKQQGCGRAMWEYEPTLDRFGTPMALMLLPVWTHGCIGSMEGLFFESSATVPYHFLNQAELSQSPSSAMRDLPYGTLDVFDGVTKLQLLGVKYYLAVTPQAQQQASTDERLTLAGTVPAAADTDGGPRTWNIYSVADSDMVAPLQNLPTVMTSPATAAQTLHPANTQPKHRELSAREAWLQNAVNWYQDSSNYPALLAASGPKDWPRVRNVDQPRDPVPIADPAKVSGISNGDDRISFNVDHTGVPVLVKASYFPNWQVKGGKGPYRVTPNLMVVVPTSKHVELHYGRTPVDWLGIGSSTLGVAGVAWMWRRERKYGPVEMPEVIDPDEHSQPAPLDSNGVDEPISVGSEVGATSDKPDELPGEAPGG